jgi:hypothetical protein
LVSCLWQVGCSAPEATTPVEPLIPLRLGFILRIVVLDAMY